MLRERGTGDGGSGVTWAAGAALPRAAQAFASGVRGDREGSDCEARAGERDLEGDLPTKSGGGAAAAGPAAAWVHLSWATNLAA